MFSREQLVAAIERDELFLAYQPQMLPDGSGMAGVEALVRWQHPTRGAIGPVDFLYAVEAHGLSDELGTWVLTRASREALRWPSLTLSVNVSPTQFHKARFVERLVESVRETGFPLARLELEVVETAFFEDPGSAEAQLRHLRSFGIGLALDDFGIGYSSLSYLRRMPFTKLKIDKSFIDDVAMMQSAAIVHAVIALGRALGLKVTAEGVETAEQQKFLRIAGCHYLQGYLFSKPVPAAEIDAMLSTPPSPMRRSA
ncbi:MAG: EAL domain-containing protein [Methylobacteriaceae bacterium]|nr:EAL domain-containing protein [Methylobacteriaceae bacterium]